MAEKGAPTFEIEPVDNEAESCARCGSSTGWIGCWACCHGVVLEEDDEGTGLSTATCEWCDGKGGHEVCLSSIEWCTANPLPGCEEVGRT